LFLNVDKCKTITFSRTRYPVEFAFILDRVSSIYNLRGSSWTRIWIIWSMWRSWLVRLLRCWDLSEDCHSSSEIHTLWILSIRTWFVRSWSTPAVYGTHSMTCVYTSLNLRRDGLNYMLCVVCVERILTIFHRMSIDWCALLRLDTFVKWRSIACIVYNVYIRYSKWYRMNSPNLLSAFDLNTSRYRTRDFEFLRIGVHRTNYGVCMISLNHQKTNINEEHNLKNLFCVKYHTFQGWLCF
jgi:hypothetical protein